MQEMIQAEEKQIQDNNSSGSERKVNGIIKITKLITIKDIKDQKKPQVVQDQKLKDQLVLTKILSQNNSVKSGNSSIKNNLTIKQSNPSIFKKDRGGSMVSSILSSKYLNSGLAANQEKQQVTLLMKMMKSNLQNQHKAMMNKQKALKEAALLKIEEEFYQELRQKQLQIIDQGANNLRFHKVYEHLLTPFVESLEEFKKKINESAEYNMSEKMAITSRVQIRHDFDHPDPDDPLQLNENEMMEADVVNEKMINLNKNIENSSKQEHVLEKDLQGVSFKQDSITQIIKNQKELKTIMNRVHMKFNEVYAQLKLENTQDDKRIFQTTLQDQANQLVIETEQQNNSRIGRQFIQKLKDIYHSKSELPDQILNALQNFLDEKEKLKEKRKFLKRQEQQGVKELFKNRLTVKQTNLIFKNFKYKVGKQRGLKDLAILLGRLEFMKPFNFVQRQMICQNTDYLRFPAGTTIFEEGDPENYQFVVVKGRVSLEVKQPMLGNVPLVISSVNDGQLFGVLTFGKGEDNVKQRRPYTAVAVEDTDILRINRLYAVMFNHFVVAKNEKAANITKHNLMIERQRCQFLMDRVLQFKFNTNSEFLSSLVKKIKILKFKFGEEIVQELEVPAGLYIIKKGWCKVMLKNTAERRLFENRNVSKRMNSIQKKQQSLLRKDIKVRNESIVFEDFNPDHSVLQQVSLETRNFQNSRIMVDDHGKEIKNRIVYNDQLVFKQILPGQTFGGRTLLPFDQYLNLRAKKYGANAVKRKYPLTFSREQIKKEVQSESLEKHFMKSLMTIIADSAEVEIWFIDRACLAQSMVDISKPMTDEEQKKLYENFIVAVDEDRQNYREYEVNFIREQFDKWERFKQEKVETLFENAAYAKYMKMGKD